MTVLANESRHHAGGIPAEFGRDGCSDARPLFAIGRQRGVAVALDLLGGQAAGLEVRPIGCRERAVNQEGPIGRVDLGLVAGGAIGGLLRRGGVGIWSRQSRSRPFGQCIQPPLLAGREMTRRACIGCRHRRRSGTSRGDDKWGRARAESTTKASRDCWLREGDAHEATASAGRWLKAERPEAMQPPGCMT